MCYTFLILFLNRTKLDIPILAYHKNGWRAHPSIPDCPHFALQKRLERRADWNHRRYEGGTFHFPGIKILVNVSNARVRRTNRHESLYAFHNSSIALFFISNTCSGIWCNPGTAEFRLHDYK